MSNKIRRESSGALVLTIYCIMKMHNLFATMLSAGTLYIIVDILCSLIEGTLKFYFKILFYCLNIQPGPLVRARSIARKL